MNTLKKIKNRFTKRPFLYGGIIIIILIILGMLIFGNGEEPQELQTVTRADFINEISVSGKVVATQSAELGFDQSGRISAIYKKVGDLVTSGTIIAQIENGSVRADNAQKQAALEREQAKLASLQKGTRPEQLAISEQAYDDATSALLIAMRNTYLEVESALLLKVDTLFENGNSVNPKLDITVGSENRKRVIENERQLVTEALEDWQEAFDSLSASSTYREITSARQIQSLAISSVKTLINNLSEIVNDLSTRNSGLTQADIDTHRTTINSAGQETSAAASEEQTAYGTWATAYNELALDKSGSTPEDIAAQAAQVKAAEADVASSQAQLRKTLLVAPFDGIVTRVDLKVGEIVSPSSAQISLMSSGTFEVESYIPEINIARLQVNNPAVITLDAYGSDVSFPAKIISIDPAETIRDGVSTYKTRLQFTENDPRIKSGMTANIRITTETKSNVISVPQSIITTRDGKKYLQVKNGEETREVEVTTGSVSGLGQIEITSGLNEGDQVVLPPLTPAP